MVVPRRGYKEEAECQQLAFRSAPHIIITASDIGRATHRVAQQTMEAQVAPEHILVRFIAAAIVASQSDGITMLPLFAKGRR
jgi:hypothetical protein